MQALESLTREQLHAQATHYFKTGGRTEPEVALIEVDGQQAILKDYGRTPGWFGRIVAPILIWREASALMSLDSLAGIPKVFKYVDRRAILMEYLPAKTWSQVRPADDCYEALEELIAQMHRRGIAHGDLRSVENILIDDENRPQIVDFVARMRRGKCWNLPWNWLYKQLCRVDDSAVIKLKIKFAPHLLTEQDYRQSQENFWGRAARKTGQGLRRLLRFFVHE